MAAPRSVGAALAAAWLTGCTATLLTGPIPDGAATVYVVSRGWHTEIGLPVSAVAGPLASVEPDFPGTRFMVFGFGEREYYMAHNEGSGEMLAALFPSPSAILVTFLRPPPPEAFAGLKVAALRLPESGVRLIAMRIWEDLAKTTNGLPVRLADDPSAGSVFYASNETYDAFHTCNTWTALRLRDGGLPMNTHVLFAGEVMQQAMRIAARQAQNDDR
jgi:hypothetical protein